MKISIIIPFKNAAQWIPETVDSILSQFFEDWELIAIDDHSTDGSFDCFQSYSDSRIRVFKNEGNGIIPALQQGLKLSTGDFITRMDADDIMPPGRLQTMHDVLVDAPPKTVVTGKVQYFSDTNVSEGYRNYEQWLNERIEKNDHYHHIFRECVVASPNWMTRKQDLIESNIFNQLEYPEDYDMTFRWYANRFSIKPIDAVTLHWREHQDRTSRNSNVYDQDSFFQLKLKWFLELEGKSAVGIIGAGQKGKITATFLKEQQVPFRWFDLNHETYNTPLIGVDIEDYNLLSEDRILIAVYPKEQTAFLNFISAKGYTIGKNAWFL